MRADELEQRHRRASEPHERNCWPILWLLASGQTATAIAESTGYSAYRIGQPAPDGEHWASRTLAAWMAERLGRPLA